MLWMKRLAERDVSDAIYFSPCMDARSADCTHPGVNEKQHIMTGWV